MLWKMNQSLQFFCLLLCTAIAKIPHKAAASISIGVAEKLLWRYIITLQFVCFCSNDVFIFLKHVK